MMETPQWRKECAPKTHPKRAQAGGMCHPLAMMGKPAHRRFLPFVRIHDLHNASILITEHNRIVVLHKAHGEALHTNR